MSDPDTDSTPAPAETVRNGVCLKCGGAVLESGDHIDPERHAVVTTVPAAGELEAIVAIIQNKTFPHYHIDGWQVNGSRQAAGAILARFIGARGPSSDNQEALKRAIWAALEPRVEDVIRLDLNDPAGNKAFGVLVSQMADAITAALPCTCAAPSESPVPDLEYGIRNKTTGIVGHPWARSAAAEQMGSGLFEPVYRTKPGPWLSMTSTKGSTHE